MSRRSGDAIAKKAEKRQRRTREFRGFVNYSPSREEKREYVRWTLTSDPLGENLLVLLEEGYKVSMSADERSGAFMAAVSIKDGASPNADMVLTARAGDDPLEAIRRVIFLHYYLLEEIWPDPSVAVVYQDEWLDEPPSGGGAAEDTS